MSDIETPDTIPTEVPKDPPAVSIEIAAVADGKYIDIDAALILLLKDGTVRWAPKENSNA